MSEVKPLLRQMIDNNKPHWRSETIRGAHKLLDEYEAKAKAWDRTQALLEKCTHQTPGDDYEVDWHEFEIKIDEVISDYESSESDAKK